MNKLDWASKRTFSTEDIKFTEEGICENLQDFKRHYKQVWEHKLYVNAFISLNNKDYEKLFAKVSY